jgi:hypothetical protein
MPLTNKTIVLDLDSTLIFTSDDFTQYEALKLYTKPEHNHLRNRLYKFDVIDVCEKPGTGVKSSMWGVLRPHVYEFLDFCFEYFENVIVWSAGQLRYVHAICDVLFTDPDKQPIIIYSWDDCEKNDNYLFKPLVKLSQQEISTLTLDKLFILDDNETTFTKNKDNALHIPPYEPELSPKGIMEDDETLINITRWLMKPEVIDNKDCRKTNKEDCFTCKNDYENIETYFPKIF